jgi:hypothetical protein
MNLHAFTRRTGLISSDVSVLPRARDPGLDREFHRWPLPGYVWPALERRYHSIFCAEPQLRIHGGLTSRIEAWVSRRDGQIKTLVLFERLGRCARVLNEVFEISEDELREFADAVFAHHRELLAVTIRSAFFDGSRSRYPCWSFEVSEDYQLSLPRSAEDWLASLSPQTREKFRAHLRRAQRRQPGLVFRTITGSAIDEAQVQRVIEFNRARMLRKHRRFGMSEAEQGYLRQMMRERGLLSVIEIDGEIRAGLLCTLAGDDLYMHVIAHDPAFDELRLGFLCCALTIQDAIDRRLRRFHFLWGRYDYKTRLGGERRPLSQVLLLRGPLACLTRPKLLLAHLFAHLFSVARAWLRRQRRA